MTVKANDNTPMETIRQKISEVLKNNKKMKRSEIIASCVVQLVGEDARKDKSPNGAFNICKCRLGKAIDELTKKSLIKSDETGLLFIEKTRKEVDETIDEIKRDDKLKSILTELLEGGSYNKNTLMDKAFKIYSQNMTEPERKKISHAVRCDLGRLLSLLVKEKEAMLEKGNYCLAKNAVVFAEAERVNRATMLKKTFEEKLYLSSPEAFVNFAVELFAKFFATTGFNVESSENIDGAADGGIDGVIRTEDQFGYKDLVVMQVKHTKKEAKYVPLAEIREFCGVLSAEETQTKGFFVTNALYHKDTKKFVKKYKHKYFVLIDKDKLFEMAKIAHYGIAEENGVLTVDKRVFKF